MNGVPTWLACALAFAGAFAAMEVVAAVTHRYVMHGFLWCWHRSHHEPRLGRFELNDLFAVVFAIPAILLIHAGVQGRPVLLATGLGITAYGLAYLLVHDGFVHRRLPLPAARGRWLRRVVQSHRLHHAVRTREGAVSFGFLRAAPPERLREQLRQRRAAHRAAVERRE